LGGHKKYVYAVAFSPDGKAILTGSEDNTARLTKVKTRLNSFLGKNISEELSVEQKLQFGIINIDQFKRENDNSKIFKGLEFYISEAVAQIDKKIEYLNNANILYKILGNSIDNTFDRKLFIRYGIGIFRYLPQKYISERIEKANQLFLLSSSKEELKEAYDFYSERCSNLDSVEIALKLPEYFIQISNKLLSIDTTARYTISSDLASLSWPLLQNKNFKTSLESIYLAIEADSTNQYAYITLPLALVLNNQFDEASKLYLQFYKDFVYKNYIKANRLFYLEDIADLEKRGITHPDFSRVKELLNK
jgi:hypothetical protein